MVNMSAISFEAVVVDDVIRIPEQFRKSIHRGRVQVTVKDGDVSMSKNHAAWHKFLAGLEGCPDDGPAEFERVNFDREIVL
jgi:hypothetical protein